MRTFLQGGGQVSPVKRPVGPQWFPGWAVPAPRCEATGKISTFLLSLLPLHPPSLNSWIPVGSGLSRGKVDRGPLGHAYSSFRGVTAKWRPAPREDLGRTWFCENAQKVPSVSAWAGMLGSCLLWPAPLLSSLLLDRADGAGGGGGLWSLLAAPPRHPSLGWVWGVPADSRLLLLQDHCPLPGLQQLLREPHHLRLSLWKLQEGL